MSCVLFSFSKPLEAGITDSLRLFKAGHFRLKWKENEIIIQNWQSLKTCQAEQSLQKISPHPRQWYLRTLRENWTRQLVHSVTSVSFFHFLPFWVAISICRVWFSCAISFKAFCTSATISLNCLFSSSSTRAAVNVSTFVLARLSWASSSRDRSFSFSDLRMSLFVFKAVTLQCCNCNIGHHCVVPTCQDVPFLPQALVQKS